MKTSDLTKTKIKEFEGCKLKAYKCPAGILTIGYGHTDGVKEMDVITPIEANSFFEKDIAAIENKVTRNCPQLSQWQFDAVVSFVYNLGWTQFFNSTLFRKMRANKEDITIPAEFKRWVYAGNKILPGLVTRRNWEANRYSGRV